MALVDPYRLKKGNQYHIINYDNGKKYNGVLVKITSMIITMKVGPHDMQFMHYDAFYDITAIKQRAKLARESLEKRSLKQVLKKVVNENFEW